ncbi:acyl-CoA dehydrogenase [Brevundimonas mediterranea]|uniref:3-methylmercaptopropionyl-CoA dehydrogenase n=1 Tax=Brevundimonas mediterranea TaxID=74329 RepID=A0A7Z8Y174_9CAUL|nr:acyl-CoA dehydrogenase [Brevundimonas mediterranea]VDC48761.1 3-methylmercaptopropionyl-CoA dehydrogenase [Brevundimonas mediterranea]
MSQIVNRRDLDFVLFECLEMERLFQTDRYSAFDRAGIEAVLDTAQAIAEERFLPFASTLDANEPKFVDGKVEIMPEVGQALAAFAEAGFFAAGMDEAQGGLQLPYVATSAINGLFTAANLGVASYAFLTTANANVIAAFGTDDQKARFLPPMLEGRWFGTMCLSEPQAGSSLSDIRTLAEPREDGTWRLTGSKMWISGGDQEISETIVHLVLARTPGAPPGVKGLSLFLVPKHRIGPDGAVGERNNVELAGLNHKMGHRGTTNCLLNFGEKGECVGELVGGLNKGLAHMFHMMNEARIGVGHGAVMSGLAGYLYSLDYARTRPQGRHPQDKDPTSPQVPIIEHADVRRMLMAQKAAVEGGLMLSAYCAILVDRQKTAVDPEDAAQLGLLLDLLTPIVKSWPSEYCLEANKLAIQVLGGYGYTRDYPVERFYRDNRLNHIHEGTWAIHGLDILGRKVRMQDGAALNLLVGRLNEIIAEAEAAGDFDEETAGLSGAIEALLQTTRIVVDCPDLNRGLANATLYLNAFGHVVVAGLWLWQAVRARKGLETGVSGDRAFYEGKAAACRYAFRYMLPDALTGFSVVRSLDDTCLSLTAEQFVGT